MSKRPEIQIIEDEDTGEFVIYINGSPKMEYPTKAQAEAAARKILADPRLW